MGTARKTASCVRVPVGRGPASLQSRAARRAAVGTSCVAGLGPGRTETNPVTRVSDIIGWRLELTPPPCAAQHVYYCGNRNDGDSRRAVPSLWSKTQHF